MVIGHHTDVIPRLSHVNSACGQHNEDSLSPHGTGARALTIGGGTRPSSASRHPDTTTANEFMISQRRIRVSDRAHRVTGVYGSNVVRSDTALGEAGVVDAGTSDRSGRCWTDPRTSTSKTDVEDITSMLALNLTAPILPIRAALFRW